MNFALLRVGNIGEGAQELLGSGVVYLQVWACAGEIMLCNAT